MYETWKIKLFLFRSLSLCKGRKKVFKIILYFAFKSVKNTVQMYSCIILNLRKFKSHTKVVIFDRQKKINLQPVSSEEY